MTDLKKPTLVQQMVLAVKLVSCIEVMKLTNKTCDMPNRDAVINNLEYHAADVLFNLFGNLLLVCHDSPIGCAADRDIGETILTFPSGTIVMQQIDNEAIEFAGMYSEDKNQNVVDSLYEEMRTYQHLIEKHSEILEPVVKENEVGSETTT